MSTEENIDGDASVTVLAFDTSTASMAVAIVKDGVTIDTLISFTERNHSVRIISEIKEILSRNGLSSQDIDVIAVGQGPGSYTGVRIAVTAAKTLAWTWNKPLVGISSLEALAYGAWNALRLADEDMAPDRDVWIIPIMDARRGQVYTSRYAADHEGKWATLEEDGIRLIADWAQFMEDQATEDDQVAEVWFVGDLSVHLAAIQAAEQAGARLNTMTCEMDAGAVGQLAEIRFRAGERSELHSFIPNYTQVTEAEAKLLSASRGE